MTVAPVPVIAMGNVLQLAIWPAGCGAGQKVTSWTIAAPGTTVLAMERSSVPTKTPGADIDADVLKR